MREMLPQLKQMEAIKAIENLAAGLASIREGYRESSFHELDERLRRWRDKARQVFAEHLRREEVEGLERAYRNMFSAVGLEIDPLAAYLEALLETLRKEPALALRRDDSRPDEVAVPKPPDAASRPRTARVFLVHGHDEVNLLRLERMLKDYGLQPVILKYEPGKGMTLIEKFEEAAADCGYAFVLLTPDDLVEYEAEDGVRQYAQARPNAIFELGWFYGRIDRKNVCILYKQGTKLHSDLDGISRIEFDDNVENKAKEIERELRAAGFRLRH